MLAKGVCGTHKMSTQSIIAHGGLGLAVGK